MAPIFLSFWIGPVKQMHGFRWVAAVVAIATVVLSVPVHAAKQSTSESQHAASSKRKVVKTSYARKHVQRKKYVRPAVRMSHGMRAGLRRSSDPLSLRSSVAFVIDQETQEVLFSKNEEAVLPIASLTKLMTGLLIAEAELPMDEEITISQADIDTEKWSASRLRTGSRLTRGELLHLALMASENRAASALGRTYPGGMQVFVEMMNAKAQLLGMEDTHFVEPTGLSSKNRSSARDLAVLVDVASDEPLLREYSTTPAFQVAVGRRKLMFSNTNRLVRNPDWDIGLQKTGYISEAGQCLVMQTRVAGRNLIMVFLDSAGKLSRLGDAQRIRRWVESLPPKAPGPMTENMAADRAPAYF